MHISTLAALMAVLTLLPSCNPEPVPCEPEPKPPVEQPQDPKPPVEQPQDPEPSLGAIKILGPIEQVAHAQAADWKREVTRVVPEGAHALAIVDVTGSECKTFVTPSDDANVFVILPYTVDVPSFQGGKTGTFYEWLPPLNSTTCSLSPYRLVEWIPKGDSYTLGVGTGLLDRDRVTVKIERAPKPAPLAFQMGISNSYLWRGHCGGYCNLEGELGDKYTKSIREHGLDPIDAFVTFPPVRNGRLDLDSGGALSYRNRVLAYSPGYVHFPPAQRERWNADLNRMEPTTVESRAAYYRALEATIAAENLKGRAWVYLWDEPHDDVRAALIAEATLAKANAPSALIMVTATTDAGLSPLFDVFAPVLNWFGRNGKPGADAYRGKQLWPYVSCMGSCGPNRSENVNVVKTPGPDTRLADLLIDRPAKYLFDYIAELREVKAQSGLYYSAVEGYRLVPRVDIAADAWNFGGHGDGLLYVPGTPGKWGLTEHLPVGSFRLKLLRAALEGVR